MNPQPNYVTGGEWTSGICDCCEDTGSCLKTVCCPCITFGQSASTVGRNHTSCFASGLLFCLLASMGVSCVYSYRYRSKLRVQYGLPEKPCGDCLMHWCCQPLVLCQEYRELKNRGLNPSKGWESSTSAPSSTAAPEVTKGMLRT